MNPSSKLNLDEIAVSKQKRLAERFGLDKVEDLSAFPLIKEGKTLIPFGFAKKHCVIPLEETDTKVKVAIFFVEKLKALHELRQLLGKPIEEIFAPKASIDHAIEKAYHQSDRKASKYISDLHKQTKKGSFEEETTFDLLDQESDSPVIQMLNVMLVEAIQVQASDIHFEPTERSLEVRYRIDGVLHHRHTPPKEYEKQLLTRIKVMARLDIAEHRLPQDGRIKLTMAGRSVDFRVSTVPVVYGERVVLRILDKNNIVLGLSQIGMDEDTLNSFRKELRQNQGIVLVTGPTGSGKTTTLYSGISDISSSELNIMTIEDPVEYKLGQMAQISVNPKIDLTFAKGLRHILRQDPDVIMIGEIRDKETAEIAIQASLTGHLVLSTLHTNDAPSALTRLVDMGIEPYLLTSSIIAALAQRLVRKICPHCKTYYKPSEEELKELGILEALSNEVELAKGLGCDQCFDSGYKGRHGIYELMPVTTKIKQQLLKSPDSTQLQRVALEEGMRSLRAQGAELALKHITTSPEVLRVTRQTQLGEIS